MDIPNKCQWNLECIVNTAASLLINYVRGEAPRELVINSAFAGDSKCTNGGCELLGADVRDVSRLNEASIKEGFTRALRYLSLNDIAKLIELALNLGLEAGIHAINEYLELHLKGEVGASLNELLGMALYSVGSYEQALARLNAAEAAYEELGRTDRASFIRGMSKVVKAEELRVKALRLHDEGRHDDEEGVIKESSRLYITSATIFRGIPTMSEARVNEIISMADSAEVMANYYFTHGIIDKAAQYYSMCRDSVNNNLQGVPQDYLETVRIKGDLCNAFYLLCNALENNDWGMYERAGDEFLNLMDRGLIDELTTEGAVLSYRGALDLVEDTDDAVRIYTKYIKSINRYFDLLVNDRYGDFTKLLGELSSGNYEVVAKTLNTDVNTLKLYIFSKALTEVMQGEGYGEDEALAIIAYIAGLGLDIASLTQDEVINEIRSYVTDEGLINQIAPLIGRAMDRFKSWLGLG
ncbi:hypothetical protein [Vulcanisaeta thermophila]|uniref:hypothetical protein n=1 Tax=Vulcanisaeta thermophila TaxID=867917 RepID=UPI000853A8EF|nr:hypothetical protein [Vulcanisaeta thermophila]